MRKESLFQIKYKERKNVSVLSTGEKKILGFKRACAV